MAVGNFLSELKRRHVYRAGAAYAVAAFVLIEIVSNVTPFLDLPNWIGRGVILMLVVGFPVTLLLAWMIESRSPDAAPAQAMTKLDYVLAGALIVVIGFIAYDRIVPTPVAVTSPPSTAAGMALAGPISIAVLPFVNLSGDPGQEFFSDGMTEEITSALAKVRDLKVVGRTSAFEFKGQNKDLRASGKALGASHLLEGSVRKAGNRVRITGQLIKADDGTHIWTENYDRELTDIFAAQDDIARAIAGALQVPLGLADGDRLVPNRTANTDSYQDYMRAKALIRGRTLGTTMAKPIDLLEQVVARDRDYAPAWALLAQAYAQEPNYDPATRLGSADEVRRVVDIAFARAETAARRAIALDPHQADAYVALARVRMTTGKYLEAEDSLNKALKLDALNPEVLHLHRVALAAVGRLKEALATGQQLQSVEPFVPIYNVLTARILFITGQPDAALAVLNTLPADYLQRATDIARIYASMGRNEDAAQVILAAPAVAYQAGVAETAVRLLRLPRGHAPERARPFLGELQWVYLAVGETAEPMRSLRRNIEAGYSPIGFLTAYFPEYAPLRKTETFKELIRKSGLVEYWRARGWSGFCRPVGADDFECH